MMLRLVALAALARAFRAPVTTRQRLTPLGAVNVLQRKAKEAEVKKYRLALKDGDKVKAALEDSASDGRARQGFGELHRRLKREKRGTLRVVAEYHKNAPVALKNMGVQDYDIPDVTMVSNEIRAAGAAVMAVNVDREGGCDAADFEAARAEQATAANDFPLPLPLIWMDTVVDEVQLAQAQVAGAAAVTLGLETVGAERCKELFELAEAKYGLEALVVCAPRDAGAAGLADLVRSAVADVGAKTIVVGGVGFADAKGALEGLPEDVCAVARVDAKDDQGLEEAEEAWSLRDDGFDAVWLADVLYKFGAFSGSLFKSTPDTITSVIKAVRSKASIKYARASGSFAGKGEGAKEHLGD
eukprot:CAMPEP_0119260976 /NCGR_PEP_ID=MMETSP1329-20130426/1188_1 /TAXON_ID=114041 /ORGANISM="Genus nov. species nov., Strain RCC1024" /LENGTH=356 /DNA_ID=CAMNT_0007260465 /DNA_START=147 /DNA_END=1214 /DNA_ORIENTATION=-